MVRADDRLGSFKPNVPMVARPPILMMPNREKGRDRVVMFGVTLRITISRDGSDEADMIISGFLALVVAWRAELLSVGFNVCIF